MVRIRRLLCANYDLEVVEPSGKGERSRNALGKRGQSLYKLCELNRVLVVGMPLQTILKVDLHCFRE